MSEREVGESTRNAGASRDRHLPTRRDVLNTLAVTTGAAALDLLLSGCTTELRRGPNGKLGLYHTPPGSSRSIKLFGAAYTTPLEPDSRQVPDGANVSVLRGVSEKRVVREPIKRTVGDDNEGEIRPLVVRAEVTTDFKKRAGQRAHSQYTLLLSDDKRVTVKLTKNAVSIDFNDDESSIEIDTRKTKVEVWFVVADGEVGAQVRAGNKTISAHSDLQHKGPVRIGIATNPHVALNLLSETDAVLGPDAQDDLMRAIRENVRPPTYLDKQITPEGLDSSHSAVGQER